MLPEGRNSVPLVVIFQKHVWRPCWNEEDHVQRLCRVQWTSTKMWAGVLHLPGAPPIDQPWTVHLSLWATVSLPVKLRECCSASPRVVLRMKQNKPFGTLVNLYGTCCIPGTVQSTANINTFNAHSLTRCVLILEYRCHEDIFALLHIWVVLQELHWPVSQTKTRQWPCFPSTAVKRSHGVGSRPHCVTGFPWRTLFTGRVLRPPPLFLDHRNEQFCIG